MQLKRESSKVTLKPGATERYLPAGARAVVQLTAQACRWPLGWPDDETFGFCGEPTGSRASYCGAHARLSRAGGSR